MSTRPRETSVLLLLSMLVTFEAASQPDQDCRLTRYASLDLSTDERGVLVPVALNGHAGEMRLDLSLPISVLYSEAARALELPRSKSVQHFELDFFNERVRETARIESLMLGTANLVTGQLIVLPEAFSDTAFGVLGMDAFARVDLELDLRNRKMNLFSQDHCPGQVVYWADSFATAPLMKGSGPFGGLYFEMELDGKKVDATWAPSEPTTTLPSEFTRRTFGFDETSPGVVVEEGGQSGEARRHYVAMRLTAPGLTATNTKVVLVSAAECPKRSFTGSHVAASCRRRHPLELGLNILEQLRLYFATKEGELYYTAADAR